MKPTLQWTYSREALARRRPIGRCIDEDGIDDAVVSSFTNYAAVSSDDANDAVVNSGVDESASQTSNDEDDDVYYDALEAYLDADGAVGSQPEIVDVQPDAMKKITSLVVCIFLISTHLSCLLALSG